LTSVYIWHMLALSDYEKFQHVRKILKKEGITIQPST
jgi:hypothetical protein